MEGEEGWLMAVTQPVTALRLAGELRPGSRAHPGDQVLEGSQRLGGEGIQHLRAGGTAEGDILQGK